MDTAAPSAVTRALPLMWTRAMPSYKSTSSVLLFACCLTPAFSYLEEMEVHFTPDQEAQLAQLATKAGTDAEHLVKAAALRLLEDETYFHVPPPELPVLHLGAMKSLHRRDIF